MIERSDLGIEAYVDGGIFVSTSQSGKNSNIVVPAAEHADGLEFKTKKSMVSTHYIRIAVPVKDGTNEYVAPIAQQMEQRFKWVPLVKTAVVLTAVQQATEERLYAAKSVESCCD